MLKGVLKAMSLLPAGFCQWLINLNCGKTLKEYKWCQSWWTSHRWDLHCVLPQTWGPASAVTSGCSQHWKIGRVSKFAIGFSRALMNSDVPCKCLYLSYGDSVLSLVQKTSLVFYLSPFQLQIPGGKGWVVIPFLQEVFYQIKNTKATVMGWCFPKKTHLPVNLWQPLS